MDIYAFEPHVQDKMTHYLQQGLALDFTLDQSAAHILTANIDQDKLCPVLVQKAVVKTCSRQALTVASEMLLNVVCPSALLQLNHVHLNWC